MRALLLLLLAGCQADDWSYHFGVSQGDGTNTFDGRPLGFDTETTTLHAGLTYSPGVGRRHDESLDALRRLEIATVTGRIQPIPQDTETAEDDSGFPVPDVPENRDTAINQLIWAGTILVLALAVGIAHKLGVPIPLLPKKKKT